jgi:DeoR/GlpR family transcriptional regulator of sugar metabolism
VELAHKPHLEIIVLGGRLYRHSMVNVGASVIESAQRMRADLFFMGVTGVHTVAGLSTADHEEAAVKRALHACAAETVVLASPEKLGAASRFVVAPLQDLAALLVAPGTPARTVRSFEKVGVRVVVCA